MRSSVNACSAVSSLCIVLLSGSAAAQGSFPSKPIRFIVPNAAASSADILSRTVAQKMSEQLQQQVIVDVRPGASGIIGTELAKNASPDGYTIFQAGAALTVQPALKKLPYDPERDFIPLSRMAWVSNLVAVSSKSDIKTLEQLIQQAKARPGELNYGSAGNASPSHLSSALLDLMAGIKTVHIPYKGNAQVASDIIGGRLTFVISSPLVLGSFINSGQMRVLATTAAARDPLFKNLPTVAETLPGYEMTQWWGVALPAKAPAAVVTKLHQEIVGALKSPDVSAQITKQGAIPQPDSQAEFAAFMKAERSRMVDLIKRTGITED